MTEIPSYIKNKIWAERYPEQVDSEIEIPNVTLMEFLENQAEEYLDRTIAVHRGNEFKFKEIIDRYNTFASALSGRGMGKGDTLAIFMLNSPDWETAYHGAIKAGVRVTGVNPLFSPRRLKYQLNDSESETIVIDESLLPIFQKVEDEVWVENVIVSSLLGGSGDFDGSYYRFEDLIENNDPTPPSVEITPNDVAILQYTRGVTGLPKGCMLSHKNMVSSVIANMRWYDYVCEETGKDRLTATTVLPWYNIQGQAIELNTVIPSGSKGIIISDFDIEKTMNAIEEHECEIFFGVPRIFLMFTSHPKFEDYDLSSLILVISGADPLPDEVFHRFKDVQGVEILNGYGLSEATAATHLSPPFMEIKGRWGIRSIGLCYPNILSGIIDPDKEEPEFLESGEEGELVVSGPQLMKGYWKRPEETEKAFFEADGRRWLRTGDIAFMDEEGFTYQVDRKRDIINIKGRTVYPREIEEVYFEHPNVSDIAVIGLSDEAAGEIIKAYVVPKGDVGEEELIEYGEKNLPEYKRPEEIEFLEEIPQTDSGMYFKRVLEEREKSPEEIEEELRELRSELEVKRADSESKRSKLKEINEKLEKKKDELETFVYTVSHDLRTPLIALEGFSEILEEDYGDELGEEGRHYLERVKSNVDKMDRFLDDLLELSRVGREGEVSKEKVDVRKIAEEVVQDLETKIEEKGIDVRISDDLPELYFEKQRFYQIYSNLISNAYKYMDESGQKIIEVDAEEKDSAWLLSVSDTGKGIEPEMQDKIFEIFQKGEEADEKGTGVGLAILKRIVDAHNGEISVDSEVGKGTTFTLEFPKEEVEPPEEKKMAE